MKINKTYLNVKYIHSHIKMHHHFLENHSLNTQGEDQTEREGERIQRKICKDQFFFMLQGEVKNW
jgi:hypothetical protein